MDWFLFYTDDIVLFSYDFYYVRKHLEFLPLTCKPQKWSYSEKWNKLLNEAI